MILILYANGRTGFPGSWPIRRTLSADETRRQGKEAGQRDIHDQAGGDAHPSQSKANQIEQRSKRVLRGDFFDCGCIYIMGEKAAVPTKPAWKSKPSWYLVSTEDRMIPPDAQRAHGQTSWRKGSGGQGKSYGVRVSARLSCFSDRTSRSGFGLRACFSGVCCLRRIPPATRRMSDPSWEALFTQCDPSVESAQSTRPWIWPGPSSSARSPKPTEGKRDRLPGLHVLADKADAKGPLQPVQPFMTNPAGAAIVNAIGPIRQLPESWGGSLSSTPDSQRQ